MFRFSQGSIEKLKGVHPDLIKIASLAIKLSAVDFKITEGLRLMERQRQLLREGKTRTLFSRHITGHAVDVMACVKGEEWEFKHYKEIARAFKAAALQLDLKVEWGGDWATFKDGPHFQLPKNLYP